MAVPSALWLVIFFCLSLFFFAGFYGQNTGTFEEKFEDRGTPDGFIDWVTTTFGYIGDFFQVLGAIITLEPLRDFGMPPVIAIPIGIICTGIIVGVLITEIIIPIAAAILNRSLI